MSQKVNRRFAVIGLIVIFAICFVSWRVIPTERSSNQHFTENVLKQDLLELRRGIDLFTEDNLRAPKSLEELVAAGYFKELPTDPITKSNKTWRVVMEDLKTAKDPKAIGVSDVFSGAPGKAEDGSLYSAW